MQGNKGFVGLVSKNSVILHRDSGRLSRVGKAGARKVGTAQSTILLNRKVHASVTDSATEKYTAKVTMVLARVKTRGKSSRGGWRHSAGVNLMGCKSKYRDNEASASNGLLVRRLRVGRLSLRATAGLEK